MRAKLNTSFKGRIKKLTASQEPTSSQRVNISSSSFDVEQQNVEALEI